MARTLIGVVLALWTATAPARQPPNIQNHIGGASGPALPNQLGSNSTTRIASNQPARA
jgi:hypothetical protein